MSSGGRYWGYYLGNLPCSQVAVTYLKIELPSISSMGARSSIKFQWFHFKKNQHQATYNSHGNSCEGNNPGWHYNNGTPLYSVYLHTAHSIQWCLSDAISIMPQYGIGLMEFMSKTTMCIAEVTVVINWCNQPCSADILDEYSNAIINSVNLIYGNFI